MSQCRDTNYDLCIVAGENFRMVVIHKSEDDAGVQTVTDLTGYTAEMNIKKRLTDTSSVMNATCEIATPVNGEIVCTMTPTETASLIKDSQVKSNHFYDLTINNIAQGGTNQEVLLQGKYQTIR